MCEVGDSITTSPFSLSPMSCFAHSVIVIECSFDCIFQVVMGPVRYTRE